MAHVLQDDDESNESRDRSKDDDGSVGMIRLCVSDDYDDGGGNNNDGSGSSNTTITTTNNSRNNEEMDMIMSKEDKEKLSKERTKHVAIDFFFNYFRWSFSLFIFFASRSIAPIRDVREGTRIPLQRLNLFVQQEANAYYTCTEDAFLRLEKDMIEAANREMDNVRNNQAINFQLLQDIEKTTNACAQNVRTAQRSLFQWNGKLDQPLPFLLLDNLNASSTNTSSINNKNRNNSSCSSHDRSSIATSLGQDFRALESEMSTILGDYRVTSESSFVQVRNYAQLRTNYDYNYFVRDRLEPALVLLHEWANTTINSVEFSVDPLAVLEELKSLLEVYQTTLVDALHRIDLLMNRLESFYDNINEWQKRYQTFYDYVLYEMLPYIPDRFAPNFDLTPFKVPDTGAWLPARFELVTFEPWPFDDVSELLPNFENNATIIIFGLLETLAMEAQENFESLQANTRETLNQIRDLLTLDDYDPPQYQGTSPEIKTLQAESTYLHRVGVTAEANAKKALDKAQGFTNNASSSDITAEVPDVTSEQHVFSENTTTFGYHDISVPGFVSWLLRAFEKFVAFLVSYTFLAEALWNTFRIWRIHAKHKKQAIPELPEITFGAVENFSSSDDDDEGFGLQKRILSFALFVGKWLLNPWILALFVLVPIAIATTQRWYPHVINNCVVSNNGTNAANFILPYVLNQASTPGNVLHTESEYACFRKQRQLCTDLFTGSEVVYRNDVTALANLQHMHNQSLALSSRLERCIDKDTLDMDFMNACCGLEGYGTDSCAQERAYSCPIDDSTKPPAAFLPLGHYLDEPHCHANMSLWELKESRFDCKALGDSCSNSPCTGVDEELIKSMVVEAVCQLSFSFIRTILFVFVVGFHWAMANLVVPLGLSAFRCFNWQDTNPFGIQFKAQMDKDGSILKGASKKQRGEKTEAAIRQFRRKGWVNLCLAVMVCVVWFIIAIGYLPEEPKYHR